MIDNSCCSIFRNGQIADGAEIVGQRPDDRAGHLRARYLLIGHDLIHRVGLPQVAMAQVAPGDSAAAIFIKLKHNLIAIISKAAQVVNIPIAVRVDFLLDQELCIASPKFP